MPRQRSIPAFLRILSLAGALALAGALVGSGAGSRLEAQVVINEIHYHPRSDLKDDEFIELYNAGATDVDLSGWSFTDGVVYTFADGVSMPPGSYRIVAYDAENVREKHALTAVEVLGSYTGALSNGGERVELSDAEGELVDSVEYVDEYPWPESADGEGPSLECIDPFEDNSTARNWLPSENRSTWVPVSITGEATSSRLYIYLEGAGECLIDDLRITEAGSDTNLFPEGGFESGAAGWNMTGTHSGSFVTTDDAHTGSAALHIVATGPGLSASTSVNREIDALVKDREYTLSFWAMPLSGNDSLINRVSGGGLIRRTILRRLEGTPARENSARSDDLPPLIRRFGTDPAVPAPGQSATLFAIVEDDNVTEVTGTYDFGGSPVEIPLRDDGLSGDGVAGDGLYAATIPAAPRGTIVDFKIRAADASGYSVETPVNRYPVADPPPDSELPVISIFVRDADWSALNANMWTDDYFPAVVIYEGEVFTDVGLRFRGGRPRLFRKKSLKLSFPKRHMLDGRRTINLNAAAMDDDYITEPLGYWFYERAGLAASRARPVRVERNGQFWGLFIDVEQVNEQYLRRLGLDEDGALYKAVGVVGSLRKLDGMTYNGQEYSYESQYEKKSRKDEPYDDLIEFIHGLYSTPSDQMESYLEENLEVEQYINYLAASNVMCVWDNMQHNFYMYRDTEGTGKWRVIPWDLDHAWGEWEWRYYYNETYHIFMGTQSHPFAGVWYTWNKLWSVILDVPRFRNMYLQRVRDLLNTRFAEGPLNKKIDALRALVEPTVLLDEAKWPDAQEPLHTGPRRTMAEEIPLLKQNISRRRTYLAGVLSLDLENVPADAEFLRGDVDSSSSVDIADAVKLLWYLFLGGNALDCEDAADADDNGVLDITDAVAILRYLFRGGQTPADPGPGTCGDDPTGDALGCDYSSCGS